MSLLSKGEINTTLSLNLESQLSRIESTSHRIAAASFKWSQTSLFAGLDISFTELAQSWIALVIEINHRWQQERLARIIDSGLDSEKLLTFNQALENAIRVASGNGYRHLLDSYERVTYDAGSSEQIQHTRVHEKKYFTKLHDEDGHYVQALGDQYGIHMVRQGDDHLLQFFISNSRFLPTRKEWESLQPYFDRAINQFIETNHKISCFLVPHNPNLYRWLQNTPNYLPHFRLQLSEKLPMLEGLYKDIPVYGYSSQNNEMTLILALDLNRAVDLNIGEPSTEIRTYTEEEIRQRLEAHPDEPREELLSQVIVKAIQPFEVELIDRDAILRMKIKLPAIERSVFVNSN